MKYLAKLTVQVYSIYAFLWFLAIMVLLVPVVIVASFFGKVKGGNIIYDVCHLWADLWMFLVGVHHTNIYENPHNRSRPYIFVCNHISYMDVPVMMKAIRKQHFRVLGKAELGNLPIFGFIFKKAAVSVDRRNAENRAKSIVTLQSILKRQISVVIFPEGTFNETRNPLKSFYDGAFKIAVETQTPIKPILFLDTFDRLNHKSILSLTPGRSRAVYLEETDTAGLTKEDVPYLKEKIYHQMSEGLKRYHATWIKSQ